MAAENNQRPVLICTDGSEQAKHAFESYLQHHRKDNDLVIGLNVVEIHLRGQTVGPFADAEALGKQVQEQVNKADHVCGEFLKTLKEKGIKGKCEHISGDKPGAMIIEQAKSVNAELIVMGTRGLGAIRSLMAGGSVSHYVTKHTTVPVIVVPFHKEEGQKAQ